MPGVSRAGLNDMNSVTVIGLQASPAVQGLDMEWLYRVVMEPRHLFLRYLIYNSRFPYYSPRGRLGGMTAASDTCECDFTVWDRY